MNIREANKLVARQGFKIRRIAGEIVLFHPRGGFTKHHSAKEALNAAEHYGEPVWPQNEEAA